MGDAEGTRSVPLADTPIPPYEPRIPLELVDNALQMITGQIFYLKTKGKNRGYIEKTQVQQETTGSIQFDFS